MWLFLMMFDWPSLTCFYCTQGFNEHCVMDEYRMYLYVADMQHKCLIL